MVQEISHLSYHTFSKEDIKYIPHTLKLTQPGLENIIKGTACGGYSNVKCNTCNRLDPLCLGHFHKLECPGIRLYIKSYDYILIKLSDYICFNHRGLTCDPVMISSKKYLTSLKKLSHCTVCNSPVISFTCKKDDDCIKLSVSDNRDIYIDPIAFYECITKIPNNIQEMITEQSIPLQDMFYVDAIPITPTYLRLSTKFDRVNEYAHYLTNKYIEIITAMKEYYKVDIDNGIKRIIVSRIQIKLNEIIDGKESVDPKFESCSGYLKTKYNLFREYINGKRNPKTARVVLNANAIPKLNYFYPCIQYIDNITTSILYCDYTRDLIESLINNGVVVGYYSKSKNILCNNTAIHTLEYGDHVEVLFPYGDRLVISGRQPALHITNICTSKGIVIQRPYINSQSTQLPTCVLPGMNGDQDGDEVWSKEVQGIMSKYEQRFLMLPSCNMISPGHGGINYGIIQDELLSVNALLGMTNLSYYQTVLLLGKYMEYLLENNNKSHFSGREIISAVIPKYLNKEGILINGIIQHSRLKSADLGVGGGTVFSITKTLMDFDPVRAKNFLESVLKIGKSFITMFPQGVRFKDILANSSEWKRINEQKDLRYKQIEENRQRYLKAVEEKRIIPMDSDYSNKFIKLEVAKVVNEVTDSVKNMVNEYLRLFKCGMDFNRLVLYILAEFKLDLATLSIIYSQANPSIEPKQSYLDRISPIYPPRDRSLGNLGLIRKGLMDGLKLEEMILLSGKARENVVTTVCQTASKGEIGRYIIKNLENYHINYGLRFLVLGKYIMSPCINVYKMPVRQMFLVNLDFQFISSLKNSTDILDTRIVELYKSQVRWLFNSRTKKYETQLAYLTDIQTIFNTFKDRDVLSSESIVSKVDVFFNYIHEQYMLGFSTTDMLKLITMVYAKKYNVTEDGLAELFKIIETKYKLYPEDGASIGVEAGTSISEVETQSTLSAHLQFTKNGCDVKSGQASTNISLMKINVNNTKSSSARIYTLISKNYSKLLQIKYGLEFVSLEDIMLNILYGPVSDDNVMEVRIVISRGNMKKLNIQIQTLDLMFENYFNSCSYILEVTSDMTIELDNIIMNLQIKLTEKSKRSIVIMSIKQGVSKGAFSMYRYLLETSSILNPDTLLMEEQYIMTCEIPHQSYLADFDTTEITVVPSIETSNKLGPMHAYNSLASHYLSTGLMNFHTTLLAQHQSRHGLIRRVEKNPEDEMSTVSKIAFIKPMKDLQEAVKQKRCDTTDDIASRVLLNMPMNQGTGIVRVSTDIRWYINNNQDNTSKITSLVLQ